MGSSFRSLHPKANMRLLLLTLPLCSALPQMFLWNGNGLQYSTKQTFADAELSSSSGRVGRISLAFTEPQNDQTRISIENAERGLDFENIDESSTFPNFDVKLWKEHVTGLESRCTR